MKARNIPIEAICLTKESGEIQPIKFRIKHKNGEKVIYRVIDIKDVKHQKYSGMKVILYYAVISINNKERNVVFRFDQEKTMWELAMI